MRTIDRTQDKKGPADSSRAERQVVRHDIRQRIQESIIDGRLPPGTKLVQMDLASEFDVGQGVIREALLELQAYGLVETVDNRGIYVAELSVEKLIDAYEVREMHEALAVRACCDRVTRAQIRELRTLVDEILKRAEAGDIIGAGSLDREFHHRLIQLSGNSMLMRLADNYVLLGKIVRKGPRPNMKQVHREHRAVLKAIEEGRPDDAERLIRRHIRIARETVWRNGRQREASSR